MSPENLTTSKFYLPYNQELVARAKELRKNMTVPEKKLWYGFLNHFSLRVLRQRPIDNFIVDFYCAKLKLVIEVDGDSHFTDEGRESDRRRTAILESCGLKVIRFTNEEVLYNFDAVCQAINQEISPSPALEKIPLAPLRKGGIIKSPLLREATAVLGFPQIEQVARI